MFEDLDALDDVQLATRLKHLFKLFRSVENEFKKTAENRKTYPRGYERLKTRKIMKNVKEGIKKIEHKNPLYIEMPTLKAVGDGYVKKEYDKNYIPENEDKPEEIDVYTAIDGYIEDKK